MATTDIFGRRALQFGGAFAADSAQIDLGIRCEGIPGGSGLLTQQLNIQYQQPITRLYEVGTQFTYSVAGRPQGTASLARILGPGTVMAELYSCLGDVCQADKNDMCFCIQAGCLSTTHGYEGMQLCIKNVVLQSLGFSVQAQDMIINEQMSLFFTALLAENGECTPKPAPDIECVCFGPQGVQDV